MFSSWRLLLATTACLFLPSTFVSSHTVITYPGWRGDNLNTNGSIAEAQGLGFGSNNTFPYGMQWMYPCGGMPLTSNRTKWPVTGGAVGIQPGWFNGHSSALIYINLGHGTVPENHSLVMQPMFGITGPNNLLYNGSICMPQVSLPVNYTAVIGQNATIQVVEAAQHGAALYNCVDITFADPKDVPEVTPDNCANTSNIAFDFVYSTSSTSAAESTVSSTWTWIPSILTAGVVMWTMM